MLLAVLLTTGAMTLVALIIFNLSRLRASGVRRHRCGLSGAPNRRPA